MKKAKDLIIGCEHDGSYIPVNEVIKLIKIAQIDAIEETCRICANNADADYYYSRSGDILTYIIEESILSLADKLKKELE